MRRNHARLLMARLAIQLVERRQIEKLSLRDVASVTGVSASTLSRLERGIGILDVRSLVPVLKFLDISVEDFSDESA